MKELISFLRLVHRIFKIGSTGIGPLTPERIARYKSGLMQLGTLVFLFPLALTILGVTTGWSSFTAWGGVWCLTFSLLLIVWATPIAIAADAILRIRWMKISWYAELGRGLLLSEALTFSILTLVPIRNAWGVFPFCLLCVIGIILMSYHWKMGMSWFKPMMWYGTIGAVIVCLGMFFWPALVSGIKWMHSDWNTFEVVKGYHWLSPHVRPQIWRADGNMRTRAIIGLILILAWVAVGSIALLVTWVFGRKAGAPGASHAASPASSHGSGHGGGGSGGLSWKAIFGVVVVIGIIIAILEHADHPNNPYPFFGGPGSGRMFATTNPPRTTTGHAVGAAEIAVPIPDNYDFDVVVREVGKPIWIRPEGSTNKFRLQRGEYLPHFNLYGNHLFLSTVDPSQTVAVDVSVWPR